MSFAQEFSDMMRDTITHQPCTGYDRYGKPTYGASTSYPARVVRDNKMARNPQGEEVVSTCQVRICGTPAVTPADKITLSDGTVPVILSVSRPQDETGDDASTKVYFQ
jgi:hypothetical protein